MNQPSGNSATVSSHSPLYSQELEPLDEIVESDVCPDTFADKRESPEDTSVKCILVHDITFVGVGNKISPTFRSERLQHLNPMNCFTIVIRQSNGLLTSYFDFETRSAFEREAVVSALMVTLHMSRVGTKRAPPSNQNEQIANINSHPSREAMGDDQILTMPFPRTPERRSARFNLRPSDSSSNCPDGILSPRKTTLIHSNSNIHDQSLTESANDSEQGTETTFVGQLADIVNRTSEPASGAQFLNMPLLHHGLTVESNALSFSIEQEVLHLETDRTHAVLSPISGLESKQFHVSEGGDNESSIATSPFLHGAGTESKTSVDHPDSNALVLSMDQANMSDYSFDLQGVVDQCSEFLQKIDDFDYTIFSLFDSLTIDPSMLCFDGSPFEMFGCIDGSELFANRDSVESAIQTMLGSPSRVVSGFFGGEIWSSEKESNENKPIGGSGTRVFRNRSAVTHEQALYLHKLRTTMTISPQIDAPEEASQQWIQTTRSMDEESRVIPSPVHKNPTPFAEILNYDSDPESSRPKLNRNILRQMLNRNRTGGSASDCNDDVFKEGSLGGMNVIVMPSTQGDEEVVDSHKTDPMTEFKQEITNGHLTLLWHPTQSMEKNSLSPVCVKLWVELGSRFGGTYVQPKLMWVPAHEGKLEKKQLNISEKMPEAVQLLDVCRVLAATEVDRDLYPLAYKARSFFVETISDVFLFEAESASERDRFVHGMKLVIARLASQLIVGDSQVYEEFFTPGGEYFPGEEPCWAAANADD
eukprot:scaffold135859_cov63-Attheya_sp.AAC.3